MVCPRCKKEVMIVTWSNEGRTEMLCDMCRREVADFYNHWRWRIKEIWRHWRRIRRLSFHIAGTTIQLQRDGRTYSNNAKDSKSKSTGSIWVQMGDYHNTDENMSLIPERFVTEMVIEHGWSLRSKLILPRPNDNLELNSADEMNRFRRDWQYLLWFVNTVLPARNSDLS